MGGQSGNAGGMGGMGGMSGGGGMGGIAGVDISNPTLSGIISTMLNWGSPLLPRMNLNRTEQLEPQTKRAGAKRVRLWYGPMSIDGMSVSLWNGI